MIKIHVDLHNGYDIIIGNNLFEKINQYISFSDQVLIITDNNIPQEYLNQIIQLQQSNDLKCHFLFHVIQAGENSKTLTTYQDIMTLMINNHFTRQDMVIALGGGVVGDLAGYIAATYKRGCRFINIPTSTLAMVDSSVGGKVAINFQGIKNAIGTFYQPELVLINLDTLKTLPRRQYYNGLVEALKTGLIIDKTIIDLFEDIDNNLPEIIYRSLMAKKKIVEEDEKEVGIRKLLNFGHTIGHGIESSHFDEIYHGEAVAFGMVLMIENKELKKKILRILKTMNIVPYYDRCDEVYQALLNDKKRDQNNIFVIKVYQEGQGVIEKLSLDEIYSILKGAN